MGRSVEAVVELDLSAEQVAAAFWELCSNEQADFFAALERMAGIRLCVQMAGVVNEIRKRSERGDRDAQNGFQTMLAHAQGYAESATDYRVWEAQREIARMTEAAIRQATEGEGNE